MADTSKIRTFKRKNFPQNPDGTSKFLNQEFGRLSGSLDSLKELAESTVSDATALEARVTTAETTIVTNAATEVADVATLTAAISSEATTRASADTALDGRLDTVEAAAPTYALKGANTDITSLAILMFDPIPLIADYPDDRTITFRAFPMGVTVVALDAACGVGSTKLQLQKNGTDLGSQITADTGGDSTTYSTGNTFTAGTDILSIVRSDTSSDCEALSGMIHVKRLIPG